MVRQAGLWCLDVDSGMISQSQLRRNFAMVERYSRTAQALQARRGDGGVREIPAAP